MVDPESHLQQIEPASVGYRARPMELVRRTSLRSVRDGPSLGRVSRWPRGRPRADRGRTRSRSATPGVRAAQDPFCRSGVLLGVRHGVGAGVALRGRYWINPPRRCQFTQAGQPTAGEPPTWSPPTTVSWSRAFVANHRNVRVMRSSRPVGWISQKPAAAFSSTPRDSEPGAATCSIRCCSTRLVSACRWSIAASRQNRNAEVSGYPPRWASSPASALPG